MHMYNCVIYRYWIIACELLVVNPKLTHTRAHTHTLNPVQLLYLGSFSFLKKEPIISFGMCKCQPRSYNAKWCRGTYMRQSIISKGDSLQEWKRKSYTIVLSKYHYRQSISVHSHNLSIKLCPCWCGALYKGLQISATSWLKHPV